VIARGEKLVVLSAMVLAASSFFLSGCRVSKRSATALSEPSPIPGFPDTPVHLQSINTYPASDAMRDHGWNLIKYLAPASAKDPVWRSDPSWKPKCGTLDLSPYCGHGGSSVMNPIFPGTSRQAQPDEEGDPPVFSTVFYNQDAASFILTNGLNKAKGLQQLIKNGDINPDWHAIILPAFPHSSIIVKEVWEGFNLQLDGTAQPFPNQPVAHIYILGLVKTVGLQLEQVSRWPAVPIKLDKTGKIDEQTECSDSAPYDENHSIPIKCFYYVHSPGKCIIPTHPQAPVGNPPQVNYPCYGILVGFQIATAETDNWTWTTFWWTNDPKRDPAHSSGQPAGLGPQFTHFVMDTTFGPIGSSTEDPGFVYNPYLEGPRGRGTQSDCFNCHNGAVYIPQCTVGVDGPTCTNHNTTTSSGAPVDYSPCAVAAKVIDRVNKHCALITGHIWSLATNQDPDSPFPVLLDVKLSQAEKEKVAKR
jgi:hypothetical protein